MQRDLVAAFLRCQVLRGSVPLSLLGGAMRHAARLLAKREGSEFAMLTITAPVSPNLMACARIFSSIAALPTSPFNAPVTYRLLANSNLDVILVPPSRYIAHWPGSFARCPRFQLCDAWVGLAAPGATRSRISAMTLGIRGGRWRPISACRLVCDQFDDVFSQARRDCAQGAQRLATQQARPHRVSCAAWRRLPGGPEGIQAAIPLVPHVCNLIHPRPT